MKNNGQPSLYVSPGSKKSAEQKPDIKQPGPSPYLRAVLSEKVITRPARVLSLAKDSMAAALRYIANSSRQSSPMRG